MFTIHKYQLKTEHEQTIVMPAGAEILCAQVQHDIPCIWALVNAKNEPVRRTFRLYETGHSITPVDKYIGSYQLFAGTLMWHLFELCES